MYIAKSSLHFCRTGFIMTTKYHNARILSIQHLPEQDKLLVRFADHDDWEIDSVVDFSFNGFYPQNILFHVTEHRLADLPAKIAAEFPVLSYYLHSGEEWQIFHLSPQAGLGGIIVCATLG